MPGEGRQGIGRDGRVSGGARRGLVPHDLDPGRPVQGSAGHSRWVRQRHGRAPLHRRARGPDARRVARSDAEEVCAARHEAGGEERGRGAAADFGELRKGAGPGGGKAERAEARVGVGVGVGADTRRFWWRTTEAGVERRSMR